MNDYPEAKVFKIVKGKVIKLVVRCPYCAKNHCHGGGLAIDKLLLGERVSDCLNGTYVLKL